ncbi:MAG: extracellular solute-binding protein [Deltaproteobacteria bacterium]|nr:extracellular solute-binding protein [Deltaproteobacteria bacterium]
MFTLILFIFACDSKKTDDQTSDSETATDTESDSVIAIEGEVEIFTWWTALGEADALSALLNVYNGIYPNIDVIDISGIMGDGAVAMAAIKERIDNGEAPPDVMQISSGSKDINSWIRYNNVIENNKLQSLDFLWEQENWTVDYPPRIKETMTGNDGHIYSVPIGMHRFNNLVVNKSLVPQSPTTYQEFIAAAQNIASRGIAPVVICEDPWILNIMLHSIMASISPDLYVQFYSHSLDVSTDAGQAFLRSGLERFLEILTYAAPADATTDDRSCWLNATDAIYSGAAAMFFHPDWVKGYLTSLGFSPGIDFDSVAVFDTAPLFRFNVDSFVLFKDAQNMDNAVGFLTVVGSPEGQIAFNTIKGSSPVHPNIDQQSALWDAIAASTKQQFDESTYRLWDLEYLNQDLGMIGSQLYKGTMTVDEAIARF